MLTARCTIDAVRPEALEGMREEWEELWRSFGTASPFLSPAWLLAWTEAFAPGKVHAVTLRSGGELMAILPVFAWDRALLLAGTGPSDHGGLLVAPGFKERTGALLQAASEIDLPFERIDLQQLSPQSPLAETHLPRWRAAGKEGDPCLVLNLGGKDGMGRASKRMRSNWRYAMRRFEREGGAVERVPHREIAPAIAMLERLHTRRWEERGESGVLADAMMQRLLRIAAEGLSRMGLLRLFRLRMGADKVAVLFAMRSGSRACYFISGFDPEYAQLSPGTALVGQAIAEAASEGATMFDFLRSAEDYKLRWGAEPQDRLRRVFTRPG